MGRKLTFTLILLLSAVFFMSCDFFYSGSMGKEREYDIANININARNCEEWLERAVGNPKLAETITQKILQELRSGKLNSLDRDALRGAAVKLAAESSGLNKALINNGLNSLTNIDESGVKKLLKDIQSDFGIAGNKAAKDLADIAGFSILKNGGVPEFDSGYAKNVSPSDAGQAVIILTMAIIGKDNLDNIDLDDLAGYGLDKKDGKMTVGGNSNGKEAELTALAAYLNLIAGEDKFKGNPVTSAIQDAFKAGA